MPTITDFRGAEYGGLEDVKINVINDKGTFKGELN